MLDVLDDQRCAAKVIHIRPACWVVHRVGEVADEQNVFAVTRHVAQAERPAEHAHVRVHADEQHVANAARLKQIPNLDAVVADHVAFGVDLDQVHLPLPRATRVAAERGQALGPSGVLGCVVVLAAVGVVDGVALVFLHRVNPVAPTLDGLGLHGGGGRGLGTFAGGVVFVKIHARRRRVNDQRTPGPCGVEKLIHARRHFADAADGVFAVMQIPHVADDHRRRLGVPKNFLLSHGPVAVGVPDAVACVEGERFSVGQCERKQDGKNGGAFHEIDACLRRSCYRLGQALSTKTRRAANKASQRLPGGLAWPSEADYERDDGPTHPLQRREACITSAGGGGLGVRRAHADRPAAGGGVRAGVRAGGNRGRNANRPSPSAMGGDTCRLQPARLQRAKGARGVAGIATRHPVHHRLRRHRRGHRRGCDEVRCARLPDEGKLGAVGSGGGTGVARGGGAGFAAADGQGFASERVETSFADREHHGHHCGAGLQGHDSICEPGLRAGARHECRGADWQ
mgnify:FL=1